MNTRYCAYVGCGEAFSPTETANEFCSWECEEYANDLEDEPWDACPCEDVDADEDPLEAHDETCPVRVEQERTPWN